jgi:hypothetical protein
MLRSTRTFLYCLALALFGSPALGHAYSACVGTSAELDDAMAQAAVTTDASISIRIREGTYVSGSGIIFYVNLTHSNQSVNVSGGWSGAACENRRYGAESGTVLVGSSLSSALLFNAGFGTTGNTFDATDLTLRNDEGTSNDAIGACLTIQLNAGSTARAYRMLLDGCVGNSSATLSNSSGDLTFANSVVRGGYTAGAPVYLYTNNGTNQLAHLTITGNTATSSAQEASGLHVLADPSPVSAVTLGNSVVWGGVAPAGIPDIATNGPGITFIRAHYETRSHLNAPVVDNMPSHGDPRFLTSTHALPRPDSLLVDSGAAINIGGGMDVDGNTRTQGAAVDVGAYERDPDLIHADGFDR